MSAQHLASEFPDRPGGVGERQLTLVGVARAFARDQLIFDEGDVADQVYKVMSGAARTFRMLADGRRQITGFHMPGDIFGLEFGDRRREAADALGESVVTVARRSSLVAQSGEALWRHALAALQRSQAHVMMLGSRSAAERVASFLLELAERDGSGGNVALAMSRLDIADYLGLTIETVSRTLTQLQADGLIRIASARNLSLARPAALAQLCG